MLLTVQ